MPVAIASIFRSVLPFIASMFAGSLLSQALEKKKTAVVNGVSPDILPALVSELKANKRTYAMFGIGTAVIVGLLLVIFKPFNKK
jgi:hypothetical protein